MENIKKRLLDILPGAAVSFVVALAAIYLKRFNLFGIELSSLMIAIILGILLNQIIKMPSSFASGFKFSGNNILKFTIILLGFRLSLSDIMNIGGKGLIVILVVCPLTLIFTMYLGRKMKLKKSMVSVIASGFTICGASAIAAAAPIVEADEEDVTTAIAMVTILGTISMLVYPLIATLTNMPDFAYSVWNGATVAETAQVMAAGGAISESVAATSAIVKLTRILLIIPVTFVFSVMKARESKAEGAGKKVHIPSFVILFFVVVLVNSTGIIPASVAKWIQDVNNVLITWAMAGLGLRTNFRQIRSVGLKPLYLTVIAWAFISVFGYLITSIVI